MKFYGSRSVWNSSLFVQPVLSSSKLGDLKFLRAPFQRIQFFWDVTPSLWVSAAHVSKDRLHPSSRVKRGVGWRMGALQMSLFEGRSAPLRSVANLCIIYFLAPCNFMALNYVSGHVVAQLVVALRYKLEVRGFDTRWCHLRNPSGRIMVLGSTEPVTEKSTRNIYCGKGGRCLGLTTLPPSYVYCREFWEPQPPGTCPGFHSDCSTL
jgi:hypothetical protein